MTDSDERASGGTATASSTPAVAATEPGQVGSATRHLQQQSCILAGHSSLSKLAWYRCPAMRLQSFEAVVGALNAAGVRYLIAGGLAVNAHGYLRFTHDVDLVVQLLPKNVELMFQALELIDYRPIVPVVSREFADQETRNRWVEEKGMTVLSFNSEIHREMPVDVFVDMPFDFDAEFERSLQGEVLPGLSARFVSIATLINMKRAADRPRDRDDIEHLQWIVEESERPDD
jgi:hypothetical protein